jgi:hypothetical protein
MSFFLNEEQEDKTGAPWVLVPVGGGEHKERVKEGEYGGNAMYSCMKMKKGEGDIKENDGGSESKM